MGLGVGVAVAVGLAVGVGLGVGDGVAQYDSFFAPKMPVHVPEGHWRHVAAPVTFWY